MRIVRYRLGDHASVGVLYDDTSLVDVHECLQIDARIDDIAELLEIDGWQRVLGETMRDAGLDRIALDDIQLLAPVASPSKVIGAGMNYRAFLTQVGEPAPEHPTFFNKTASSLTGPGSPVVIPPQSTETVPEGELAIIIGRAGFMIDLEQASDHIGGYACAADINARNLEFRTTQWASGKMMPTFCPLGPYLVTPDEVDPTALSVTTRLNGTVIQQGCTDDMSFDVFQLVAEVSQLVTLEVGDVILSGTPSDLGETEPPIHLHPGDELEVEVENVGLLRNPVVAL